MEKRFFYKLLFVCSLLLLGLGEVHAQLEFKLQLLDDTTKWGVYVRHNGSGGSPTTNTITGSGQVTIIAPTGFLFQNLTNVSGSWLQNARVNAPTENATRDYISVGFQTDNPQIIVSDTSETLLFTFTSSACPDTLYLIDNGTDPFNVLPNSAGTNPGNDLAVWDVTRGSLYNWANNYAFSAWSCNDCDMDGLLNGTEDTNGNGVFDPGVDDSDLCDPCDPYHPSLAEMSGDSIMCSVEDNVPIFVEIVDGWSPYKVVYQNAAGDRDSVLNYISGDPIVVSPTASDTFTIVSVTDSRGCSPDTIRGQAAITVEGPLSVDTDPTNVTECHGNGTTFSAVASNSGASPILYTWQISTDNGGTFLDLSNGTPYTGATTITLQISNVAGLDSRQYRVKIYTATCDTVFSAAAILRVEGPLSITQHPSDTTECSGNAASFTAGASNAGAVGTLNLLWQVSVSGGAFVDLSNTGVYTGTSTTTLDISNVANLYNRRYRMKAWTGECDTLFTDPADLIVEGPIAVNDEPDAVSNCAGQSVNFVVGVTNGGNGTVTYQWQGTSDGITWYNLANDTTYNGVRSDTLSVDIADSLDGTCYRVQIWTGECAIVTSAQACLTVSAEASFSLHPVDIDICAGLDTFFAANASVQQGTFTYQWQVSTDGGNTYNDLSNDATYSGVTDDTLRLTNLNVSLNGYRYRVRAITLDCAPAASREALLRVEGPLNITAEPESDTICVGSATFFDVTVTNPGFGPTLYQWQVKAAGSGVWANINSNNATYNGVRTNRLSVNSLGTNDGNCFRCIISTAHCAQVVSAEACLVLEGPIGFSDHPDDVSICSGTGTQFFAQDTNANSGTVVYNWQVSTDLINFTDIPDGAPYSGVTTLTLTISDVAGLGNTYYRLKAETQTCDPVYSDYAKLSVEGPLSIDLADQPQDVTLCADSTALFTVGVNNPGSGTLNYQWQRKAFGAGAWALLNNTTNYNGVNTDTLSVSLAGATMNGDSFRVVVWTDTCANVVSAAAVLSVEGPIVISAHPQNDTICAGSPTIFGATVTNPGAGTMVYEWQVSTDNGATWGAVPNAAPYSGVATQTLEISAADATLNGYLYRLAISLNTCAVEFTDPAKLVVEGPISFTVDGMPDNVTTCSADDAFFQVQTTNTSGAGTVTYQWQVRPNGAGSWSNASNGTIWNGATSPRLSIGNVSGMDSLLVRCIIRTGECSRDTSDEALLRVQGPLEFTNHPDDITVCSGSDTIFVVEIDNPSFDTVTYQWRISSDGINFSDLANGGIYNNVTGDTLRISDVAGLNGWFYRCRIKTSTCNWINSDAALLTVEGPITIVDQPDTLTTCNTKSIFFAVGATNGGPTASQYQWEISYDDGATWSTIVANDTFFNGVRTDTLSVSDVNADSLNGTEYRVRIWTSTCNSVVSQIAKLTIEGPNQILDHPNDTTVCSAQPAFFEIITDSGQGGTITYEWLTSTNGITWITVPNAAPYSGVATARLDISNVAGLGGRRYRARIQTGFCDPILSDPARLTVEGPVTFNQPSDQLNICANSDAVFTTSVTNNGSGAMTFQWEVSTDGGTTWNNVTEPLVGGNYYDGVTTPTLFVNQVADTTNAIYFNGYQYRLRVNLPTCTPYYSDIVELGVVSDTLGHCDFDLDGDINDIDLDDDDDGVPDTWEYSCLGLHNYDVDADNNTVIDGEEDKDGDQFNNREELDNDGVFDGDPCDPCDPIISINCYGISLQLRAYLYGGLFDGVAAINGRMKDSLRTQGLIPLTEPYSKYYKVTGQDTTWYFKHVGPGGGETIADSAAILGVTGNDAIVDWVFVELRSANKIDSVIATRAALVQSDGDIVSHLDGTSEVTFPNTVLAGPYYVAIRHRNHLGLMTIDAPELSPQVRSIDFTDTTYVPHGKHPRRKKDADRYQGHQMVSMWAGDMNQDAKAIYQGPNNDVQALFLKVIADAGNNTGPGGSPNANYIIYGYLNEDYDLDGKAIYQGPKNDRIMVLLQTVLSHDGNENILANYIVIEQIP
jgi:hypothetical protein